MKRKMSRKHKKSRAFDDPSVDEALRKPTISPGELWELGVFPVGRDGIYEACNNGEIECFRRGWKYVIPTAPLRRKLGLSAT